MFLIEEFDGSGGAAYRTSGITAAEMAFGSRISMRSGVNGTKGTRDGAQMATDTLFFENDFCAGACIQSDRIDGADRHTPRLIALEAGVGSVRGFFIEDMDANKASRGLKGSRLHPRASQLTLHATGTPFGHDTQRLHHSVSYVRISAAAP